MTTLAEQMRLLKQAQEKGFAIPDEYYNYVLIQDRKARGIRQVWTCPCSDYESELRLKAVACSKGHNRILTWQDIRT